MGSFPCEGELCGSLELHYKSTIEHYPGGSVVARILLTANPSVYTPEYELIANCWREKEMVQPHPLI